jgi:hypothetical protein
MAGLYGGSQSPMFIPPPPSAPQVQEAIGQVVSTYPLERVVGPTALQVSTTPILAADFTDMSKGGGLVAIANLGPNTLFWGFHDSATRKPGLTTGNGIPIFSNTVMVLDVVGGMAVWVVCSVLQVAPADTRVSGAKI